MKRFVYLLQMAQPRDLWAVWTQVSLADERLTNQQAAKVPCTHVARYRTILLSDYLTVGLSYCRTILLSDYLTAGLSYCRTTLLPDYLTAGLPYYRTTVRPYYRYDEADKADKRNKAYKGNKGYFVLQSSRKLVYMSSKTQLLNMTQ